jgi:predicted small lipoprotein YifL
MVPATVEPALTRPRDSRQALRLAAVAGLVAAFLLAGCGRKGPLDPPAGAWEQQTPTVYLTPQQQQQQQSGIAVQTAPIEDRPVAAKGIKRPLPIDVLID